ncbi:hypothetical protein N7519_007804 [Penicillium mononematosum]|uniref:uncharacterized protein n=1 Tax=Penicillium mononematosum TaxID=268346 RepID=UPI0025479865|nr:uncharacterized protein N7519_007804 [Penicillium mononematosum]KAJ6186503.1 hypothetical protein N7519_007804 [Penicillium mononematosum]
MVVIAVAGGFGDLGKLIVESLLATGKHEVYSLTRKPPSSAKPIKGPGGKEYLPIIQTDYAEEKSITTALEEKNVHTIISTLGLDFEDVSNAQLRLISAAAASKCVKRFAPSEFNVDYDLPDSVLPYPEKRFHSVARRAIEKTRLEYTYFVCGMFMDYFGMPKIESPLRPTYSILDLQNNQIKVPGNGKAILAMTMARDVGRYVAAAVDLPQWPKVLTIIGSQISLNDLVDVAVAAKGNPEEIEVKRYPIQDFLNHSVPLLPSNEPIAHQFPGGEEQLRALLCDMDAAVGLGAFDIAKIEGSSDLVEFLGDSIEKPILAPNFSSPETSSELPAMSFREQIRGEGMVEVNDSSMIQGTVEEFLDGLDGHIYADIEGLAAIFLEDQPWSGPAIAIAREVATSHRLAIKSYEAFATWIKNVQNAARPYQILGENATQPMWLETIPRKSLVLTNGTGSPTWSSVLALGEITIDCPFMVGFRNLCARATKSSPINPAVFFCMVFIFVRTPDLVTQIIASYLLMDDASLGVSDLIKHDYRGNYIECEFGGAAKACWLYLDDSPIFARVNKTIFSDGLTCYRAQLQSANDWNYAVKIKWCELDEGSETEMLELATEKDCKACQSWVCMRLYIGTPKGRGGNSGDAPHATIGEKMLKYVVVAPLGESLHRFKSIPGLLCALRDALKGHRSLYQDGGILHQDISPGNIIIPAHGMEHDLQGPKGVLIDLDLASPVTTPSKQFESVGTPPFQAIGQFRWAKTNYNYQQQAHCRGRPVDKARTKTKDMHAESFRAIMDEFTPEFKVLFDLAEELRELLFPMRDGKLWTGTDHTTQGTASLYNGMIDAFDKAAKIAR